MNLYHRYPLRAEPMHHGQWWLPGMGTTDPIMGSINILSDGVNRLRAMYKGGVVMVDATNEAFFTWWKQADLATAMAHVAIAVTGATVAVPKALYEFWLANPNIIDVPAKILGQGLASLTNVLLLGGLGLGLYLLLSSKPERTSEAGPLMSSLLRTEPVSNRRRRR